MKIVVLKNLSWDTSRGGVAEALKRCGQRSDWCLRIIEEYRNHVLFLLNGTLCCVLLVPGAGHIDADRRSPRLLLNVDEEADPQEAQFSPAMQDEVRSIRNAATRFYREEATISKIGLELGAALGEEGVV